MKHLVPLYSPPSPISAKTCAPELYFISNFVCQNQQIDFSINLNGNTFSFSFPPEKKFPYLIKVSIYLRRNTHHLEFYLVFSLSLSHSLSPSRTSDATFFPTRRTRRYLRNVILICSYSFSFRHLSGGSLFRFDKFYLFYFLIYRAHPTKLAICWRIVLLLYLLRSGPRQLQAKIYRRQPYLKRYLGIGYISSASASAIKTGSRIVSCALCRSRNSAKKWPQRGEANAKGQKHAFYHLKLCSLHVAATTREIIAVLAAFRFTLYLTTNSKDGRCTRLCVVLDTRRAFAMRRGWQA